MRKVPPGIHTMFSNGGLPGASEDVFWIEVAVWLITSSFLSSLYRPPVFLSMKRQRACLLHFSPIDRTRIGRPLGTALYCNPHCSNKKIRFQSVFMLTTVQALLFAS